MVDNGYRMKFVSSTKELKEIILKAYQVVKKELHTDTNKKFHSLEHTIRVANTCLFLAKELDGYGDVLLLSALFHDIGRPIESKTGRCHAEIGVERVQLFLEQEELTELSQDVCDAIMSHRFSKNIKPKTLEAEILQDADALDALGAFGLFRTLGYSFEKGRDLDESLEHFYEKLFTLSSRMHFPITKKLAKEREKILYDFVAGINEDRKKEDFNHLLKQL